MQGREIVTWLSLISSGSGSSVGGGSRSNRCSSRCPRYSSLAMSGVVV